MLEVTDLYAAYGPVPVLVGVNLIVSEGEVLALLGRNGVGKTTLMRSIIGLLRPSRGSVCLNGQTLAGLQPYQIARRGIAYVPQGRGIFAKLTVRENLLIGTRSAGIGASIPSEVFEYFPILQERLTQAGATLSGGQQQMLAIGRGLCSRPKVLLLDEPSEGVQPNIVQEIGKLIREIVERSGISVLLVEQNVDLALQTAHRCMIMEKGCIVHEGAPQDMEDETVLRRYLAI
jgi:urea ABC transporter ATP-binding protein UrtE